MAIGYLTAEKFDRLKILNEIPVPMNLHARRFLLSRFVQSCQQRCPDPETQRRFLNGFRSTATWLMRVTDLQLMCGHPMLPEQQPEQS